MSTLLALGSLFDVIVDMFVGGKFFTRCAIKLLFTPKFPAQGFTKV